MNKQFFLLLSVLFVINNTVCSDSDSRNLISLDDTASKEDADEFTNSKKSSNDLIPLTFKDNKRKNRAITVNKTNVTQSLHLQNSNKRVRAATVNQKNITPSLSKKRDRSATLKNSSFTRNASISESNKTRSLSVKKTRPVSLKGNKKITLSLFDKHQQNEIELTFRSNCISVQGFLKNLAEKWDCNPKHVRLTVNGNIYGKKNSDGLEEREIDYSKKWFTRLETCYALNIKMLKEIQTQDPTKLFYTCKVKRHSMDYNGQNISYTQLYDPQNNLTTIKFNLEKFEPEQDSITENRFKKIKKHFLSQQFVSKEILEEIQQTLSSQQFISQEILEKINELFSIEQESNSDIIAEEMLKKIKNALKSNSDINVKETFKEIKALFRAPIESDYTFKIKGKDLILKNSFKNSKNFIFENQKLLNFNFPDIKHAVKSLNKIDVFENNCIGTITIQDINYQQKFNEVITKKRLIELLKMLENREDI